MIQNTLQFLRRDIFLTGKNEYLTTLYRSDQSWLTENDNVNEDMVVPTLKTYRNPEDG